MTITTHGKTYTVTTEAELRSLLNHLRFEIRSEQGQRRFYIDGREVSEAEYLAAAQSDTQVA